jgi:4-amino-4-deoxy-L-arabinose transferase-like glycosyltransferase
MYAAMAVGSLIKGPIAVAVPAMVIFCYFLFTRKWFLLKKMHILLGAWVYFVVVAPWYLYVEARNPGYLRYFLWEEHFVRYLTPHFSRTQPWYYFFLVLAVGFLPWIFFLPYVVTNLWKRTFTDADLFLVLWIILPFIFFSASHSKLPHYILPIYPGLALLTGQAVAAKTHGPTMRQSRLLFVPGIFAIGFVIYLLIGAAWPTLLANPIRATVTQNVPLLVIYGAIIFLIFVVFVAGDLMTVWRNRGAAYVCTAVGLALLLVLSGRIIAAASFHRASKSLSEAVVSLINPGDRIVFYDTYIEGIPFYLRSDKPVWLVQAREKEDVMGSYYVGERRPAPAPGYGQVLFTFEEFAEQWQKNERPLKVFVKEKNLAKLENDVGTSPKILRRFDDYLLVTNR